MSESRDVELGGGGGCYPSLPRSFSTLPSFFSFFLASTATALFQLLVSGGFSPFFEWHPLGETTGQYVRHVRGQSLS